MGGPDDARAMDAEFVEVGEQRRAERRGRDRRAGRMRFDPLFAALLLRHVTAPPLSASSRVYDAAPATTAKGTRLNLRA